MQRRRWPAVYSVRYRQFVAVADRDRGPAVRYIVRRTRSWRRGQQLRASYQWTADESLRAHVRRRRPRNGQCSQLGLAVVPRILSLDLSS